MLKNFFGNKEHNDIATNFWNIAKCYDFLKD